ncbi:MAG: hypothetical protein N2C14_02435 [Planctomycetales bacterium]
MILLGQAPGAVDFDALAEILNWLVAAAFWFCWAIYVGFFDQNKRTKTVFFAYSIALIAWPAYRMGAWNNEITWMGFCLLLSVWFLLSLYPRLVNMIGGWKSTDPLSPSQNAAGWFITVWLFVVLTVSPGTFHAGWRGRLAWSYIQWVGVFTLPLAALLLWSGVNQRSGGDKDPESDATPEFNKNEGD